jgi:hypothetical protein
LIRNTDLYSAFKNLVPRARSEIIGYAMAAANRLFRLKTVRKTRKSAISKP